MKNIALTEESFHTIVSCLINEKIEAENDNAKENDAFIKAVEKSVE